MNREEHEESQLFLRPRFSIDCERNVSDVLQTITSNLKETNHNFITKISDSHVIIDVPQKEAHFWSPQLHFRVEEEQGVTKIKGLFGPKPSVWTLFMFVHFFVATAFIGFAILFYVKNKLDENVVFPVVMLVVLPIIWFLLYFLGQIGKETGKNQMNDLKQFMYKLLENVS
ncbi:GTP-binding protein [Tenacibaculum aquimarinum]|uniref:GTP-binding protein n=1 Tax=Tenacibaculum aquimarinum TaxID=2910675 RepID=UPI001F0B149C|nr:GTP-binding protein [Tenacibaculum aquimarinum]MCH3884130.1 GTP-binding protein [Tenacibaculum aquimarinum]